jgi:CubicO group peptidase (beta-lactamase class C family)
MATYREVFPRIAKHIDRRRREARNPALALAVTDREGTIHAGLHGVVDLDTGTPIGPETMFEIGSVSKTFGAVVAMQAREAGLLDLRAPVTAYLPWFEAHGEHGPITIHHLLSHSAGFVYSMDYSPDPRGVVYGLRDVALGFAPGAHYYYSEPGYQTLTAVLEKVYAKSYAEIVRQGIFEPLGMTHSASAITHALRPSLARGYAPLYDDRPPHDSHPLMPAAWLELNSADGAIASTGADMARFVRMLLNRGRGPHGPILSEESFALMTKEAVKGSGYGYGIGTWNDDKGWHLFHSGDMPGYEGYFVIDVDIGLGMALLATQPYPSGLIWQVRDMVRVALVDGVLPEMPLLVDPTNVENAGDYAGVYRAVDKTVAFVAKGKRLFLDLDGERAELEARGEDRFYVNHPGFELFYLQFGRAEGTEDVPGPVVEVSYGADWYVNDKYRGPSAFDYPPAWDAYVGHYRMHNPWQTNFRVVVRKGKLLFVWPQGDEELLTPLDDGSFRLGDERSPERLCFDQVVEGQALRATLSGCHYYRFFTP